MTSRAELARRKRQQDLAELLDHLADESGRLDTPEDEAEIARYMALLGGVAEEPDGSGTSTESRPAVR